MKSRNDARPIHVEPAGFQSSGVRWCFEDAKRKVKAMAKIVERFRDDKHSKSLHEHYPGDKWYQASCDLLRDALEFILKNEREVMDWLKWNGMRDPSQLISHEFPIVNVARSIYRVGLRVGKVASLLDPDLRKKHRSTPKGLRGAYTSSLASFVEDAQNRDELLTMPLQRFIRMIPKKYATLKPDSIRRIRQRLLKKSGQ